MAARAGAWLLTSLLVVLATGGCAAVDRARSAEFSVLGQGGPVSRQASPAEVRRFNEAFAKATRLSDDNGTTPPARIDAVLESGETLVVWGGSQRFQTVLLRGEQYNVDGEELDELLREIAASDTRP